MRINTSYVQKCKVVAHVFQVLLIFIAGCITIAVLTKGGQTGGATKYFFALVCLLALRCGTIWAWEPRPADKIATVLPYRPCHHLPCYGAYVESSF